MTPFRDCTVFTTVNGTGEDLSWSRITHITAIPFPHQHTAVMIKRYGPIGALDRTRRETA